MILAEFKEYLAYGELSNTRLGEELLLATQFPKVISAINLGLIELHKRFPILLSEVSIETSPTRSLYPISDMTGRAAMIAGDDPADFFVLDFPTSTFPNNIVKILTVYNSAGEELPLNDEADSKSIFTAGHNVLRLPYPMQEILRIRYHAVPATLHPCVNEESELDIPPQFIEVLILYVAYRMFAAINMSSAEAVNYYAKFEAACALLNREGLWHKDMRSNLRLDNNGWV